MTTKLLSLAIFGLLIISLQNNLQIHATVLDISCMDADFLNEQPPESERDQINRGERDFGVELIKSLFQDFNTTGLNHNIFFSPSSIHAALMLAYFGAGGVTEQELSKVLGTTGLSKQAIQRSYLFERAFQAVRERNPDLGYKLTHANKLYFHRNLPLNSCIQLLLQDELGVVDFGNPEKVRNEINEWVLGKTEQKIKNLLPPGSLSTTSKVALVNAAYFKGNWASKFNSEETERKPFYVKRDVIRNVEFMKQKGRFNYYPSELLRAHVLQMPYQGEDISMIIILPPFEDDSLYTTVQKMTPETIQGVMAEVRSGFYEVDDLTVELPKFKIEQTLELGSTLQQLGLETFFDDTQSDFSNFKAKDAKDTDPIIFTRARHKSFIEVNEEGSEAAAATALFGFRSARPLFHTHFLANHPFMFLIYDEKTDMILFFGVYQDPKA